EDRMGKGIGLLSRSWEYFGCDCHGWLQPRHGILQWHRGPTDGAGTGVHLSMESGQRPGHALGRDFRSLESGPLSGNMEQAAKHDSCAFAPGLLSRKRRCNRAGGKSSIGKFNDFDESVYD